MANAKDTSSAHTPGSWAIQEVTDCRCEDLIAVGPCDPIIAWVEPWTADPETAKEAMANARLFTAAPDLLDDLKQMIALTDSVVGNWENGQELAWAVNALERYAEAARETIAKAEGN
ncbi:hypothetical protein V202x_43090 [Gimesia aquarii]|uniref:Uncharacterized protein n=2 Tax=Gimesia aquarii TaxID=2527964 RepID=A0A517X058_9PLAN|nr:hypothetical protein V202x_43090 [Gimesia aquarii]